VRPRADPIYWRVITRAASGLVKATRAMELRDILAPSENRAMPLLLRANHVVE
jgi:hypothetical protein